MGKLNKIRRAIKKNPEKWHERSVAHVIRGRRYIGCNGKEVLVKGKVSPTYGWGSTSYTNFIKKVLSTGK